MQEYKQIGLEERKMIYLGKLEGKSNGQIAHLLGRPSSTIGRELARNRAADLGYLPDTAQAMTAQRKANHGLKLDRYPETKRHTIEKLKIGWSPEAIAGRIKLEGTSLGVCAESIYQFVYSNEGMALKLHQYLLKGRPKRGLVYGRKARQGRGLVDRTSIDLRPEAANTREEFGHLEGDLTFFKGSQSSNIAVVVERKSRIVRLIKNSCKKALIVNKNLFNNLAQLPKEARKSITFDNGKEFAKHTLLKRGLGMQTFFCDPHSPWQKGQVERTNAQLHRFIPKKTNLNDITEEALREIQDSVNNIPRKCLGFKTPMEVFNECIVKSFSRCCTSN